MARQNKPRSIGGESNLAERIAYERDVVRGWSYETLARHMTEAGCSIQGSAIFKIEKGNPRRRVTVDELIALAQVFEVPVENLLTPMEVLKQEWAEQRLKDLDDAEKKLRAACSDLGDVWMDIYHHGIEDVLDGVQDDESVITYLDNKRASELKSADALQELVLKISGIIQRTAAQMIVSEANELFGEDGVEFTAEEK